MAIAKCALSDSKRREVNGPMGYKRIHGKASEWTSKCLLWKIASICMYLELSTCSSAEF